MVHYLDTIQSSGYSTRVYFFPASFEFNLNFSSNIDRLWAIWQDCHDHDAVSADSLGRKQYQGMVIGDTDQGLDTCMEFKHNDVVHPYFPDCVTPRMVHHIQDNKLSSMNFAYDDANYLMDLLQTNYGQCHWDWEWKRSSVQGPRKKCKIQGPRKKRMTATEDSTYENHATLTKGENKIFIDWSKR